MEHQNIELSSSRLKCDNPNCDWQDQTIKVEDWPEWINAKCPKCADNLLTLEDYDNAMMLIESANLLNELTVEEFAEISKGVTIEDIKSLPMVKDAKGLEHLETNKSVIMSFNTHKEVRVHEFLPVPDSDKDIDSNTLKDKE